MYIVTYWYWVARREHLIFGKLFYWIVLSETDSYEDIVKIPWARKENGTYWSFMLGFKKQCLTLQQAVLLMKSRQGLGKEGRVGPDRKAIGLMGFLLLFPQTGGERSCPRLVHGSVCGTQCIYLCNKGLFGDSLSSGCAGCVRWL